MTRSSLQRRLSSPKWRLVPFAAAALAVVASMPGHSAGSADEADRAVAIESTTSMPDAGQATPETNIRSEAPPVTTAEPAAATTEPASNAPTQATQAAPASTTAAPAHSTTLPATTVTGSRALIVERWTPATRADVIEDFMLARDEGRLTPVGEVGDTPQVLAAREAFNLRQARALQEQYLAEARAAEARLLALLEAHRQAVAQLRHGAVDVASAGETQ